MRVPSAVGCHHDPGLRLASCVTSLTERVCHVTAWMGQVGVKGKLSSVGVEDVSKPAALVPTCAVRLTFPDEARAAAALPRVNAARRGSLVTRAVYDKSRHRVHDESGRQCRKRIATEDAALRLSPRQMLRRSESPHRLHLSSRLNSLRNLRSAQ